MKTFSLFMALSLLGATLAAAAAEQVPAPQAEAGPAAKQPDTRPAAPAKQDGAGKAAAAAAAHVELDTTQITGNRELPRVLYVVPWKKADLGELSGKPTKSLLDEVLAPVDRDVFRRQNRYHEALQPDTAAPAKAGAAGGER
jgi:hypothetical protein